MDFDNTYLNKTANKAEREGQSIVGVVCHETASPNPDNPHGTLRYNLPYRIRSSYNYLIARDGTIFHYVDENKWISFHAGVNSSALGYKGYQVNERFIGVEIDGKNDGSKATEIQLERFAELMLYFRITHGIPLDKRYYLAHSVVAPGYKSDPRGYAIEAVLTRAKNIASGITDDIRVIGAVDQFVTLDAFLRATGRNDTTPWLTSAEWRDLYGYCQSWNVDAAYVFALSLSEIGRKPYGHEPLFLATRNALSIKAASGELEEFDGKRPIYIDANEQAWHMYESTKQGLYDGILQLKIIYGWHLQKHFIRDITYTRTPPTDGNDTERVIRTIIGDMRYMRDH